MGNLATGEDINPEAFQDLFTAFDVDGNGFIEKREMLAFINKHLYGDSDEEI